VRPGTPISAPTVTVVDPFERRSTRPALDRR